MILFYDRKIVTLDEGTRVITQSMSSPSDVTLFTSDGVQYVDLENNEARLATQDEIDAVIVIYHAQESIDNKVGYILGGNGYDDRDVNYYYGEDVATSGAIEYTAGEEPQILIDYEDITEEMFAFNTLEQTISVEYGGAIFSGNFRAINKMNMIIDILKDGEPGETRKWRSDDYLQMFDFTLSDFTSIRALVDDELQRIYIEDWDPAIWS